MRLIHAYLILIMVVLFTAHHTASAITPPTGQETLCSVTGEVLGFEQAEATDSSGDIRFMVPAIIMDIKEIHAIDPDYTGNFCNLPSLREWSKFKGEKRRVNDYRICGQMPNLEVGDIVRGIAGKHLGGGGPYCIEKVEVIGHTLD